MALHRSSPAHPSAGPSTDGFAAVDALVALMILSLTVILGLGAAQVARHAAIETRRARRADQLLPGLLQTGGWSVGVIHGRAGELDWQVATTAEPGAAATSGAVRLCRRTASAIPVGGGARYSLSTAQICPTPKS